MKYNNGIKIFNEFFGNEATFSSKYFASFVSVIEKKSISTSEVSSFILRCLVKNNCIERVRGKGRQKALWRKIKNYSRKNYINKSIPKPKLHSKEEIFNAIINLLSKKDKKIKSLNIQIKELKEEIQDLTVRYNELQIGMTRLKEKYIQGE